MCIHTQRLAYLHEVALQLWFQNFQPCPKQNTLQGGVGVLTMISFLQDLQAGSLSRHWFPDSSIP